MKLSIFHVYRTRDAQRIKNYLLLLQTQESGSDSFEVIFVDHVSEFKQAEAVKAAMKSFDFVDYHSKAHTGPLWNKSKALNYAALHQNIIGLKNSK